MKKICSHCGKFYHPINIVVTANGEDICNNCYEKHYFTCSCCGKIYPLDDAHETHNGVVCCRCRNKYFYKCGHCGIVIHRDFTFATNGGCRICVDCWNKGIADKPEPCKQKKEMKNEKRKNN